MSDRDAHYFQAAMQELLKRAANQPVSTRFLDMAQRTWLQRQAGGIPLRWEGGYEGAERAVAVLGEYAKSPVAVLKVSWSAKHGQLTHRDLLGGLMALGRERDVFGDIVLGEAGTAYVMVLENQARQIAMEYTNAKNVTLDCEIVERFDMPELDKKLLKGTVASLRLDAVMDIGFGLSRSKAAEAVRSGLVKLNGVETLKPDKLLKENDLVSCRGKGRIKLAEVGRMSAKGRTFITVERYS